MSALRASSQVPNMHPFISWAKSFKEPFPVLQPGWDAYPHQWLSEFVTQYWVSMYSNSRNVCKATSQYFLDCSSGQGTIIKAKWQLSSKCPSSYSTLKTSTASRIQTPTGGWTKLVEVLRRSLMCIIFEWGLFHFDKNGYIEKVRRIWQL